MHVIEKRRHIRVDDRLVLSWRDVDADDLSGDETREIMRASVNQEIHRLITALSDTSPDVVKVLQQLNLKLDLIADQNNENQYGPSLTALNLSQSGIAFEWRDALPANKSIQLTLTLPPDNIRLKLNVDILECLDRDDGQRAIVRCIFRQDQSRALQILAQYLAYSEKMQAGKNKLVAPSASETGAGNSGDYR